MIISYFAWLKEKTGKSTETLNNHSINDISKLVEYLSKKYPKLKKYFQDQEMIQIAINLKYTRENKKIKSKDEVALFPPVSGG